MKLKSAPKLPLPKTPIYEQLKAEGRLTTDDWSKYDCKSVVLFEPNGMTSEEIWNGNNRFRRQFYSFGSFIQRTRVSRTSVVDNFIVNFGNRLAGYKNRK